jgi:kynurenine formamidase
MDSSDPGDLPQEETFPIHRVFLKRGIPQIENLCNLERIEQEEFLLVALPLKLAKGEGAPARVIAIID